MKPGYYLRLNEDVHHSAAALSKTGIKRLLESPLSYSESAPWKHDPERVATPAQLQGRARHCLFLEGKESFERTFAKEFEPSGDVCRTVDDMKTWIRSHGGTPKGTKKADLADQARNLGASIHDDLLSAHGRQNAGKTILPAKTWDAVVQSHGFFQAIQARLGTGFPEVSVFWDDEELGCLCKARFDWLGVSPADTPRIVDLKDFSVQLGAKSMTRHLERTFANWRYDIDAWFYARALAFAPPVWIDDSPSESSWLEGLQEMEPEFMLLFHRVVGQISEFYPRMVELTDFSGRQTRIGKCAERDCRSAAVLYNQFMRTEGARVRPWLPEWRIHDISDSVARFFE